jgi:hypothetical protein
MNLIQVVAVSEMKTAKNSRQYQVVQFKELDKQTVINGRTVNVKSNSSIRTRNIWGTGVTTDGVEIKADVLFNDLKAGDVVEGSFHTLSTTDYTIGEGESARTVNTYSCVVFSNENAITYANRQLKQNNATVINAEAVTFAPQELEKAF